jgi:hypothetical protein
MEYNAVIEASKEAVVEVRTHRIKNKVNINISTPGCMSESHCKER